jgi:hypothetical protein
MNKIKLALLLFFALAITAFTVKSFSTNDIGEPPPSHTTIRTFTVPEENLKFDDDQNETSSGVWLLNDGGHLSYNRRNKQFLLKFSSWRKADKFEEQLEKCIK